MSDINKQFRDILRTGGHYEPNDQVWNKVSQELHGRKRKNPILPWWPLGLALLTFIGGYQIAHLTFLPKGDTSVETTATSSEKGTSVSSSINESSEKKSSIQTIIQYDTIIRYVYRDRFNSDLKRGPAVEQNRIMRPSHGLTLRAFSLDVSKRNILLIETFRSSSSYDYIHSKSHPAMDASTIGISGQSRSTDDHYDNLLRLHTIRPLDIALLTSQSLHISIPSLYLSREEWLARIDAMEASKKSKFWKAITPDFYRIGLQLSPFGIVTSGTIKGATVQELGVAIDMVMSDHLVISTGMTVREVNGKHESKDLAFTYPLPSDIQPNELFNELYITNRYLDLPLRIKYALTSYSPIRPYVTAGLVWTKNVNQVYQFEFTGQNGELKRESRVEGGPFYLGAIEIGAGMEYPLGPRLSSYAEVGYHQNVKLSPMERDKTSDIGLHIGLFYNF